MSEIRAECYLVKTTQKCIVGYVRGFVAQRGIFETFSIWGKKAVEAG